MEKKPYVGAVIAAGGAASRMHGVDKQQLQIQGIPVLVRSILALSAVEEVREIVVVAKPQLFDTLCDWQVRYHLPPFVLAQGGDTRQQSVQAGIDKLSEQVEFVAIHDGARPFATRELIRRCLECAVLHGAATAAVKAKDTIKVSAPDGSIEATPDRSRLYLTQTPQIFSLPLYKRAAQKAAEDGLDFTDDCQLVEHIGQKVYLSEGDYNNIKITTPEDIPLAEAIALRQDGPDRTKERAKMEIRAGHGYDVHRLTQGRKLILGGVTIPYEKGLLGHSDADVLVHAVMDAILGAAAMGDIGRHFPDTDPQYEGADSIQLLRQVAALIAQKGFTISNIDATIIAQKPKLKDYIGQMCENIALACAIDPACVNVKATTEEQLGFTGSGEGMSAHSVCILMR